MPPEIRQKSDHQTTVSGAPNEKI